MNEIISAFEVSLLEPTFSSILEYAELGIDSIIKNETIKGIPIVSTVAGIGKTVHNLYERNLLNQTLNFIKEFNKGNIKVDKLEKYKESINRNPKKAEEELGRVLIILDKTIDAVKSRLLAKVFAKYVNEEINWEQFCEISEAVNRLFVSDIKLLYGIYDGKITDTTQCPNYQVERLTAIGFINTAMKRMVLSSDSNSSKTDKYISINEFGELFCKITRD